MLLAVASWPLPPSKHQTWDGGPGMDSLAPQHQKQLVVQALRSMPATICCCSQWYPQMPTSRVQVGWRPFPLEYTHEYLFNVILVFYIAYQAV